MRHGLRGYPSRRDAAGESFVGMYWNALRNAVVTDRLDVDVAYGAPYSATDISEASFFFFNGTQAYIWLLPSLAICDEFSHKL